MIISELLLIIIDYYFRDIHRINFAVFCALFDQLFEPSEPSELFETLRLGPQCPRLSRIQPYSPTLRRSQLIRLCKGYGNLCILKLEVTVLLARLNCLSASEAATPFAAFSALAQLLADLWLVLADISWPLSI